MTDRTSKESAERRALVEANLARLRAELVVLERQWERKHHLAAFGLLTIPAAYFWGLPALIGGLLATPALVLTQAYLIGIRRMECRELISESERRLARMGAPVTPPKEPTAG